MAALRDPDTGCPWDREQTFSTIAAYTLEEAYEVADAILRDDREDLKEELGDLLLQVVYHARLAEEEGAFAFGHVVAGICNKMIRRHPHVFGSEQVEDARAQTEAWEALKASEKSEPPGGVLEGVPVTLPALARAVKLGRRASRVGFDWPELEGVRAKLDEELAELDAAVARGEARAVAAEMGDVLFTLANLCRHLDVEPETCLREANARFERRFRGVERRVKSAGASWERHDPAELEAYWREAKRESG